MIFESSIKTTLGVDLPIYLFVFRRLAVVAAELPRLAADP